ncbi:LysR-family transcriptional regulator YbdO [Klebsiella pneumoniae]|uniref:LysR-family transcriptional regulator YbdO n=1 Tax=Klebsiella pneumoniae TaxID=573 RepID=A0A2X3F6R8_KLEPN|nr:LysR-family transcriptional regulator YbdO [Klebsiella pneumoniae]
MINQLCHQANLQIEHHNLTTTESAEELLAYRQADLVFTRMPITNRATICQPYQTVQTLAVCRAGHPRRETLTSVESLAQEFFHSLYYQRSRYSARAAKQHRLAESAQYLPFAATLL